jgi:SRSO17 transposase
MPTIRTVRCWGTELDQVAERIGVRFGRRDLRAHAGRYLRGLISRVQRKNGWQLAEELGDPTPVNLQHFIARAEWGADSVRDDLQSYVTENLGQPDGVLIIDETGFLKKGIKSAGVKRQYSGTAGRIENCQIGVFLAYRSEKGHALIDRALYLPREWAEDAARRVEAKIPENVSFATKPTLARTMLLHALTAGVPAAWVTADEVYGSDYQFRRFCEERQLSYVVAISSAAHLYLDGRRQTVGKHLKDIPANAWRRLSCGAGSKGERQYEWAFINWPHHEQETHKRGWLVRRSLGDQPEHAYYFTYAPVETTVETLVRIAGSRWAIEECFEQAKQETGLDEYEVRSWIGWHRHITLSMLAHATLVVLRERIRSAPSKKVSSSFPSRSRKSVV